MARSSAGKPAGASKWPSAPSREPAKPRARREKYGIVHTSVYLPEAVHKAFRESAFKERSRIHDIVMKGVELALRNRGYPAMGELKARYARKGRL